MMATSNKRAQQLIKLGNSGSIESKKINEKNINKENHHYQRKIEFRHRSSSSSPLNSTIDSPSSSSSSVTNGRKAPRKLDPSNKRSLFKRSDSGLSSDSSIQSTQPSISSVFDENDINYKTTITTAPLLFQPNDDETLIKQRENSKTTSNKPRNLIQKNRELNMINQEDLFEIHSPLLMSNSIHCYEPENHSFALNDDSECYHPPGTTTHYDINNNDDDEPDCFGLSIEDFDDSTNHRHYQQKDDIYHYELKIADLKSQKELISRKLIYMEEHIIDLNNENLDLKKQLSQNDEIFKKKIEIRDDEIETFKQAIFQMEQTIGDGKKREQELLTQKSLHLNEIKMLKQKESELNRLQDVHKRLIKIESAYEQANQTVERLNIDKFSAINELEESYKQQVEMKNSEIIKLTTVIDELLKQQVNQTHHQTNPIPPGSEKISALKNSRAEEQITDLASHSSLTSSSSSQQQQQQQVSSSLSSSSSSRFNHLAGTGKKDSIHRLFAYQTTTSLDDSSDLMKMNSDECKEIRSKKYPMERFTSCDTDEEFYSSHGDSHLIEANNLLAELDDNNNRIDDDTDLIHDDTDGTIECNKTANDLFPSISDVMLRKLCLLRENTCSIESLSEQEIDTKFRTLSLAFKTDKFTLDQRVKLYRHQRDVAENDASTELANLTEFIHELHRVLLGCKSKLFYNSNLNQLKELKEMLDKIEMQVQVIQASVMKISSRSELYGAVKQEERLSTAFDVILLHLENLKRSKERDLKELEDLKLLLTTSNFKTNVEGQDNEPKYTSTHRRSLRSNPKLNLIRVRRASIASIEITPKETDSRRLSSTVLPNSLGQSSVQFNQQYLSPIIQPTSLVQKQQARKAPSLSQTRRLSVPAAEIRNRFKLFNLFNKQSRRLSVTEEEGNRNTDHEEESSSKEEDEEILKPLLAEKHVTMLDELEIPGQKKVTITPVNIDEQIGDETNTIELCLTNNQDDASLMSYGDDDEQVIQSTVLDRKLTAQKFYKELIQRLAPFEDKTMKQKISEKLTDFYSAFSFLINQLCSNTIFKMQLFKNSKNSYETFRFLISGGLILTSIFIVIWSIILPFMFK